MTDLDRLRSIRQTKLKGKARIRSLKDEGKVHGYEIDYHDGRQAAIVQPDTIRYRLSMRDAK